MIAQHHSYRPRRRSSMGAADFFSAKEMGAMPLKNRRNSGDLTWAASYGEAHKETCNPRDDRAYHASHASHAYHASHNSTRDSRDATREETNRKTRRSSRRGVQDEMRSSKVSVTRRASSSSSSSNQGADNVADNVAEDVTYKVAYRSNCQEADKVTYNKANGRNGSATAKENKGDGIRFSSTYHSSGEFRTYSRASLLEKNDLSETNRQSDHAVTVVKNGKTHNATASEKISNNGSLRLDDATTTSAATFYFPKSSRPITSSESNPINGIGTAANNENHTHKIFDSKTFNKELTHTSAIKKAASNPSSLPLSSTALPTTVQPTTQLIDPKYSLGETAQTTDLRRLPTKEQTQALIPSLPANFPLFVKRSDGTFTFGTLEEYRRIVAEKKTSDMNEKVVKEEIVLKLDEWDAKKVIGKRKWHSCLRLWKDSIMMNGVSLEGEVLVDGSANECQGSSEGSRSSDGTCIRSNQNSQENESESDANPKSHVVHPSQRRRSAPDEKQVGTQQDGRQTQRRQQQQQQQQQHPHLESLKIGTQSKPNLVAVSRRNSAPDYLQCFDLSRNEHEQQQQGKEIRQQSSSQRHKFKSQIELNREQLKEKEERLILQYKQLRQQQKQRQIELNQEQLKEKEESLILQYKQLRQQQKQHRQQKEQEQEKEWGEFKKGSTPTVDPTSVPIEMSIAKVSSAKKPKQKSSKPIFLRSRSDPEKSKSTAKGNARNTSAQPSGEIAESKSSFGKRTLRRNASMNDLSSANSESGDLDQALLYMTQKQQVEVKSNNGKGRTSPKESRVANDSDSSFDLDPSSIDDFTTLLKSLKSGKQKYSSSSLSLNAMNSQSQLQNPAIATRSVTSSHVYSRDQRVSHSGSVLKSAPAGNKFERRNSAPSISESLPHPKDLLNKIMFSDGSNNDTRSSSPSDNQFGTTGSGISRSRQTRETDESVVIPFSSLSLASESGGGLRRIASLGDISKCSRNGTSVAESSAINVTRNTKQTLISSSEESSASTFIPLAPQQVRVNLTAKHFCGSRRDRMRPMPRRSSTGSYFDEGDNSLFSNDVNQLDSSSTSSSEAAAFDGGDGSSAVSFVANLENIGALGSKKKVRN